MGYDAGKKVKGRKLHALVDTEGLPMRLVVHSAGLQDRDGAALVLTRIRQRFPWLELVWADSGYDARQVKGVIANMPVLRMEIVRRSDDVKGFQVQPRRWPQPTPRKRLRESRCNSRSLRNPRRNPHRNQTPRSTDMTF